MSDKDPFGEFPGRLYRRRVAVLGAAFEFESDSPALLKLVDAAYASLKPHRLARSMPCFRIRLTLTSGKSRIQGREPPAVQTHGGGGLLCATMDAGNFAIVCPQSGVGLVAISRELLRFPYYARYELLEFAVFTLASRAQGLASLHAGCVGLKGEGLLLVGESGAGKSTLALACMLQGMEFLSEDAVFVEPRSLQAAGIANYLHLRRDALRFIGDQKIAARVRKSPVIRRRSGVAKFEVDLRRGRFRLAAAPLKIVGVVFVSPRRAKGAALLTPIERSALIPRFASAQLYATSLPSWPPFAKQLSQVAAFELRRGSDPAAAALALRKFLEWGRRSR